MLDLAKARPQVEEMAEVLALRQQFLTALVSGPVCRTLVNCATPLTNEQQVELEKNIGAEIIEVNFSAHFDLSQPLRPQVNELARKIERRLASIGATGLDYLIPPPLSPAAHLLSEILTRADVANPVGLVWLKRIEGTQPAQFVFGGVE